MNLIKCTSVVNTTKRAGRNIRYIVIHYTAGRTSKAGAARSTAKYFSSPSVSASADFIVDDETVVQYNPDIKNRYCWHAGSSIGKYNTKGGSLWQIAYSSNSIGIEVCSSSRTGEVSLPNAAYWYFTEAVINNTVELVRMLMAEYGIPADRVIRHYDVTGKLCPGIRGWNADSGSEVAWQAFKARLTGSNTEEVVEDMTEAEVRKIVSEEIAAYFSGRAAEAAPEWAEHWTAASDTGLTDGKRPESFAKRDEVIEFLGRLGLIKP